MHTPLSVYQKYIEQKNIKSGKNQKIPKTINKLNKENFDKLEKISNYFNTIYQNINIDEYISTGFEIFENLKISHLDDNRIFQRYKNKDKKKKRDFDVIDDYQINKSLDHIKHNYENLLDYCKNENVIRQPILDYSQNKIDAVTLIFLIERKHLRNIRDEERMFVSYVLRNYVEIKHIMYNKYEFIISHL